MSTRTIEPIHIVLPDADGGYYRFGELPRLIAEALKPDTEEADADPHGDYYVFRALDQMNYEKDLPQAAAQPPGAPGYLHVVENSASKRPLEWRMGAVLNAGLVHLDWLNEWGESRKPPLVFSTIAAPEPQAATPAPVADSASDAPGNGKVWTPEKLAEVKAYREKYGTRKTAEHYQVTEQRIRQLLPGEKPKAKGYSAFTHRPK